MYAIVLNEETEAFVLEAAQAILDEAAPEMIEYMLDHPDFTIPLDRHEKVRREYAKVPHLEPAKLNRSYSQLIIETVRQLKAEREKV